MTVVTISHELDPTVCLRCKRRPRHGRSVWCAWCIKNRRWGYFHVRTKGCIAYPWMPGCRELMARRSA